MEVPTGRNFSEIQYLFRPVREKGVHAHPPNGLHKIKGYMRVRSCMGTGPSSGQTRPPRVRMPSPRFQVLNALPLVAKGDMQAVEGKAGGQPSMWLVS